LIIERVLSIISYNPGYVSNYIHRKITMADELKLSEKEIKQGAAFAAISYVLFLWLIAFILKKDNKFTHYHARQGLVIFILEILCFFLLGIPFLGILFYKIGCIVLVIFSLYGVYSSLTGKLCNIPIVTDIASKLVV